MYQSKEIRWFKETPDQAILDWFAGHGQTFDNTESRTDYYLPLGKEDITVKLREGNIEVKHRSGDVIRGGLALSAEGYFENWIKWSFNADKADKLSKQIISSNLYDWTETIKTRLGIKVTLSANGDMQIMPLKTIVDFGCQVEYTEVKLKDKQVYTFAFEWFGDREIDIPHELTGEMPGTVLFKVSESMGYGAYLKRVSNDPKPIRS